MSDLDREASAAVFRLRLIVGALITGVLVFAALAILLAHARVFEPTVSTAGTFYSALPLLVLGCTVAFGLFRRSQSNRLQDRAATLTDSQRIGAYTTRTVVGAAMGESVALFSIVAYLVSGSDLMILGIVLALVAMMTLFPTEGRLRGFLNTTPR